MIFKLFGTFVVTSIIFFFSLDTTICQNSSLKQSEKKLKPQIIQKSKKLNNPRLKKFYLIDGNEIIGTLKKFDNGVYHIFTQSLGIIKIPEEKVLKMAKLGLAQADRRNQTSTHPKLDNFGQMPKTNIQPQKFPKFKDRSSKRKSLQLGKQHIDGLVNRIFSDQDLLNKVMNLSSNPKIQTIISNPQLMDAITRGEYEKLMQNPELQSLMNDPDVKAVIQAIQSQR
ncbi:hypothetical protein ACFL35_16485 [Candidatus Riflebacteria bacterium]